MDHAWHDADGLPVQIEYGDLAHTTTDFGHDDRRRLRTVQTYRGPPVEWTAPPVSYSPAPNLNGPDKVFQSILEDAEYLYDDVDNPTEIRDWRNPAVWPDGAKPVTQKAKYDDLYRLTKLQYQYTAGDDTWTDPYAPEHTGTTDTRRGAPSPEVSFGKRVLQQSYQYDWLGNLTDSQDDAKGFYDRSLGAQTHSGTKPYQLTSATGAASTRDGNLTLAYDAAGNMSSMALLRNGPCLPSTATCSQRFAYDWDEVGRLSRARRWDQANPGLASDPLPQTTPAVELRYTYDASDGRVLKTAVDASSNERHTAYIFGSLELRGTTWDGSDFADTKDTEVAYLFAHGVRLARLHYSEDSLPTLTSGKLHVLLELPDHLGSSSIVVDRETGELVEKSSYQAYGNPDSDYRPARWSGFREDYRFTGKEEDVEVGVQYFGKRYLAASLGRWLSPDPLAVHSPGSADLNLYAYVHGSVLKATDPLGLDDGTPAEGQGPPCDFGGSDVVTGNGGTFTGYDFRGEPSNAPDHSDETATSFGRTPSQEYWSQFGTGLTPDEAMAAGGRGFWNGTVDLLEGMLSLSAGGAPGGDAVVGAFDGLKYEEPSLNPFSTRSVSSHDNVEAGTDLASVFWAAAPGAAEGEGVALAGDEMSSMASDLAADNRGGLKVPFTGAGYGVNDPPVRIEGEWSVNDMKQALLGHPPRGLGSPDLHHADQMPGSGIHEVPPDQHRGSAALHPNKFNQGVTPEMRKQDRQLHWWYRAREQGADEILPDWIYDNVE